MAKSKVWGSYLCPKNERKTSSWSYTCWQTAKNGSSIFSGSLENGKGEQHKHPSGIPGGDQHDDRGRPESDGVRDESAANRKLEHWNGIYELNFPG